MSSLNKVCLLGNVGKEPEIRTFQNGSPCATFSLATSTSWKDKTTGEKKMNTEWHKIVCFSSMLCVTIQQYVKKGSKIYLEGSLRTREYKDKMGNSRYTTEVVLNEYGSKLLLLDKRDEKEDEELTYSITDSKPSFKLEIDDEVPF